ncbi:hypothetical protein D3C81_1749310 [compost metagenome]
MREQLRAARTGAVDHIQAGAADLAQLRWCDITAGIQTHLHLGPCNGTQVLRYRIEQLHQQCRRQGFCQPQLKHHGRHFPVFGQLAGLQLQARQQRLQIHGRITHLPGTECLEAQREHPGNQVLVAGAYRCAPARLAEAGAELAGSREQNMAGLVQHAVAQQSAFQRESLD